MTAAVVAAGLSNWIPFFDFGPSEAITIAAAVELSTSVAEESIALTTLTTAKTTLEEATLEYELVQLPKRPPLQEVGGESGHPAAVCTMWTRRLPPS